MTTTTENPVPEVPQELVVPRRFQVRVSPEGDVPEVWELTEEAHRYDPGQLAQVLETLDRFSISQGNGTPGGVALVLAIWVLSSRNGPDPAKRMHLLECAGAEFEFAPRIYGMSDDDYETDPKKPKKVARKGPPLDWLHLTYRGLRFRCADFIEPVWREEMLQRLALHREYASRERTTVSDTAI